MRYVCCSKIADSILLKLIKSLFIYRFARMFSIMFGTMITKRAQHGTMKSLWVPLRVAPLSLLLLFFIQWYPETIVANITPATSAKGNWKRVLCAKLQIHCLCHDDRTRVWRPLWKWLAVSRHQNELRRLLEPRKRWHVESQMDYFGYQHWCRFQHRLDSQHQSLIKSPPSFFTPELLLYLSFPWITIIYSKWW